MGIDEVVYEENYDSHSNSDRIIATLVNGETNGFLVGQVRMAQFKQDAVIGGHYREYPEIYGVIGNATFTLEDIKTKERRDYELKTGDRLSVPPLVALKIKAVSGTLVVACSPKADRELKSHKYQIN